MPRSPARCFFLERMGEAIGELARRYRRLVVEETHNIMRQFSKTLFAFAVAVGASGAVGAHAQSTANTTTSATTKTPVVAVPSDKKPLAPSAHSAPKSEAPTEAGLNTKPASKPKETQPSAAKPTAPVTAPVSGSAQPAGAAVHSDSKSKSPVQPVKAPNSPSDTSAVKGSSK